MPTQRSEGSIERLLAAMREYDGLTPPRLASKQGDDAFADGTRALLEHRRVLGLKVQLGCRSEVAAIHVVRYVAQRLSVAEMLYVDACLNLQLLPLSELAPIEATKLYADTVTTRRRTLMANWQAIYGLATREYLEDQGNDPIPEAPKEGALRNSLEKLAFSGLVAQLDALTEQNIKDLANSLASEAPPPPGHKLLAFGSAVMDILFTLPPEGFPDPHTSVQVRSFGLHPGGKALTQAVAARRLDLDVSLVAAIGDDANGELIQSFLEQEGVDSSLLTVAKNQLTPVTGVITFHSGATVALGWKNETYVQVSPSSIGGGEIAAHIANADLIYVTFELPVHTVNAVLAAVAEKRRSKSNAAEGHYPFVIVTPAPPDASRLLDTRHFGNIDILVANDWELRTLLPNQVAGTPIATLARELIRIGIRAVCVTDAGQAFFYAEGQEIEVPRPAVPVTDQAGERDALCAALAYLVIKFGPEFDRDRLAWATAAMAKASMTHGVADSMPTVIEVDHLYAQYMR